VCIVNARGGSDKIISVIDLLFSASGRTSNAKSRNSHIGEGVAKGDISDGFDFLSLITWGPWLVEENVLNQQELDQQQHVSNFVTYKTNKEDIRVHVQG